MDSYKKNIVVLISGSGSNMAAIVVAAQKDQWKEKLNAGVVCVISNRPDARGLGVAAELGIATQVVDHKSHTSREAFDAALQVAIDKHRPALVVLAGFMRILTQAFVEHYAGRMVNIHPSLLPAFPGLNTHQRAIDGGCRIAGASVHLVTADLDHGPVLAQAVVPVLKGDDAASLATRVLSQEHLLYPQAIFAWLKGAADRDEA
jgi:phosphoribosylglycinamide formyltransferase 1